MSLTRLCDEEMKRGSDRACISVRGNGRDSEICTGICARGAGKGHLGLASALCAKGGGYLGELSARVGGVGKVGGLAQVIYIIGSNVSGGGDRAFSGWWRQVCNRGTSKPPTQKSQVFGGDAFLCERGLNGVFQDAR